MFPRYVPQLELGRWIRWLACPDGSVGPDWNAFGKELCGQNALPFHRAFNCLRTGLYVYFGQIKAVRPLGHILLSSQICAAVPQALAEAGLPARYVDIDPSYPTPSARQYADAINDSTAGLVIAPVYGHIQDDWTPLLNALGDRILVLDLAQGLGLGRRIEPLIQRADVIGYSFGLGKGVDTGGGVLFLRRMIEMSPLPESRASAVFFSIGQALALRALVVSGLYSLVARKADDYDAGPSSISEAAAFCPDTLITLWHNNLGIFNREIEVARDRATMLGKSTILADYLRDTEIYLSAVPSHLRQVIRLKNPSKRDTLLTGLRGAGIDCAAAGEPLPTPPYPKDVVGEYPNAARFRSDAIRLPFLGRMSDRRFNQFQKTLERVLVEHLS